MSGYQPFETLRAHIVSGPPVAPVVDRALVRPSESGAKPVQLDKPVGIITCADVRRMIALREQGRSLHEIAREIGCSHRSVGRHTARVPAPIGGWKTGAHPRSFDIEFARRLRRAGFTYEEIGVEVGRTEGAVFQAPHGKRKSVRGPVRAVHRLVQHVSRISGIHAKALRAPLRGVPKKGDADLCKARAVLFWLIRQTVEGASYEIIGRSLGGFCGTTVSDGVNRTDRAIAVLGLVVPSVPARLVRTLWGADWQDGRRRHQCAL